MARPGEQAWDILQTPPRPRSSARQQALESVLAPLPGVNEQLAEEAKQEVERRNSPLLAELDQRRAVLKAQVIGSILLAALLAGGFGLWLSRPLEQIEQAIDTLGENRYDQPIAVRGPSDLQRVGQQLNWLRQRLAELEADKARFLRHISHELKTPLAACARAWRCWKTAWPARCRPTSARSPASSTRIPRAAVADRGAAALQRRRLRRPARAAPARGRQQPAGPRHRQPAPAMAGRAPDRGAEGRARPITADADKLAIAIGNLLSNAMRFSPAGGLISFRLGERDGKLLLDCATRGRAWRPKTRPHLRTVLPGTAPAARRAARQRHRPVHRAEYVAAHGGALKLLPSARRPLPHRAAL
jgi:two-component system sensor histidine kinase GlrK